MMRILALIKFAASSLVIMSILIGIFFAFYETGEIIVNIIAGMVFIFFGGIYSYYLIKTGICNLKNKPYSLNFFLIAGLVIHFISSILLLVYSKNIFPSKAVSDNLFFTTLPFAIAGVIIGVYDSVHFYKSRKAA